MTIQTTMNDRKELARMLIPFNHNEKLHYAGTPTFAFEGHGFRILRNGDIECEDEKTEAAMRNFLQREGILPQSEAVQEPQSQPDEGPGQGTASGMMEIRIPADGMDGVQMRNLVFMLHAQQYLLNRAAENENIHVPDRLIEDLKDEPVTDRTSFFAVYQNYSKEGRGFLITADTVTFFFATTDNAVKNRALIELAAFRSAQQKKRNGSSLPHGSLKTRSTTCGCGSCASAWGPRPATNRAWPC